MAKKTAFGSTKRFGPRYGRRNKDKVANIEIQHRGTHKCPFCNYKQVKRLEMGIWKCSKCEAKFAGKAYTFETPKRSRHKAKEEPEEVQEEDVLEEEFEDTEKESAEEPVDEEPEKVQEDASEEEDKKELEQAEVA